MMSAFGHFKSSVRPWVLLLIAISAAVLVSDAVFRLAVIGPRKSRIEAMEGRIMELRGASIGGPGRAGSFDRAASEVAAFKKMLPRHRSISKILGEVFGAARKNGLKIGSGDYSPETVKDMDISKYTFSFNVEGGYAQVKKFIYELESSNYPIVIEEISLARAKDGGGAIALNMNVSIYFM